MMDAEPPRGHATAPHTADVRIEAWAPSAEECYEEVVAAFVEISADVSGASAGAPRPFQVGPGSPQDLVVLLLEEVLFLLDVAGCVPCATRVERLHGGELVGSFTIVPIDTIPLVGPGAKGISYEDLWFGRDGDQWRCRATVDV